MNATNKRLIGALEEVIAYKKGQKILHTTLVPTPDRSPAMTLPEFYDALNAHDWYYPYSDDLRVHIAGFQEEQRLLQLAPTFAGGEELYDAFVDHYFSGPAWNTVQAPKPQRPED